MPHKDFANYDYHDFASTVADVLKLTLETQVMPGEAIAFLRGPCRYDETQREIVYGLTGEYVLRISVDFIKPENMGDEPGMYGMLVTREEVENPADAGVIAQFVDIEIPTDASTLGDEK
jgi:hypothetical protein